MIHIGHTYLFDDYFVICRGVRPYGRGQQVLFQRVDRSLIQTAARGDFVLHAQLQPRFFQGETHVLPQPHAVPL